MEVLFLFGLLIIIVFCIEDCGHSSIFSGSLSTCMWGSEGKERKRVRGGERERGEEQKRRA